ADGRLAAVSGKADQGVGDQRRQAISRYSRHADLRRSWISAARFPGLVRPNDAQGHTAAADRQARRAVEPVCEHGRVPKRAGGALPLDAAWRIAAEFRRVPQARPRDLPPGDRACQDSEVQLTVALRRTRAAGLTGPRRPSPETACGTLGARSYQATAIICAI